MSAPRVDHRREYEQVISPILPGYIRPLPKVTVLPLLYLRGLSTGDFVPALGEFFGAEARLSASTRSRLTVAWQAEHEEWCEPAPLWDDYVYSGPTACTSTSASRRTGSAPSSSSACAPMAPRSSSRRWTAIANRPTPGLRLAGCATVAGPPRSSRSATGRSGSGEHYGRFSPRPVSSVAGCMAPRTVLDALPKRLHDQAKEALAKIYASRTALSALEAVKAFDAEFRRLGQGHREGHR